MPDKVNPLLKPEIAAQEVLIELIRAGKIANSNGATNAFTVLMDHYRSELKRVQSENEGR